MKAIGLIMSVSFWLGVSIGNAADKEFTEDTYPGANEFGVKEGIVLNSGFVLIEGRYIEAPYRVSQIGLAVYVNDARLRGPLNWPVGLPNAANDPSAPEGVTTNTTWAAFRTNFAQIIHSKWLYTHQNFPPETAAKKLEEFYASLPFIRKTTLEDSGSLRMESFAGEKIALDIDPPDPRTLVPITREKMLANLELTRSRYERILTQGGTIIMRHVGGGEILLPPRKTMEVFPEVVEILASQNSREEKDRELSRVGMGFLTESPIREKLEANFKATPQLKERIAELKKNRPAKRTVQ